MQRPSFGAFLGIIQRHQLRRFLKDGITVNCIGPGRIHSEQIDNTVCLVLNNGCWGAEKAWRGSGTSSPSTWAAPAVQAIMELRDESKH
jgi:hypothetical protein